jgi:hypothetical protein
MADRLVAAVARDSAQPSSWGPFSRDKRWLPESLREVFMPQQPTMPDAATSPYPLQAGARPTRKPVVATKKQKALAKNGDGLSRGALAGRIAAGAALGSAASAGALLFAGKIDGKTPKRMWEKVKPPSQARKRPSTRSGKKGS